MRAGTKKTEKTAGKRARGLHGIMFMLLAAGILASACSQSPEPDPRVARIVDRLAVQDAVNELFRALDLKDWRRARVVFDERVDFDVPGLMEGGPSERPAKDIVQAWAQRLEPLQAVHHQTGNFEVRVLEFGAYVTCYVTATYYHPDQEQTLTLHVGSYDFHLVRTEQVWKVDALRYNSKLME